MERGARSGVRPAKRDMKSSQVCEHGRSVAAGSSWTGCHRAATSRDHPPPRSLDKYAYPSEDATDPGPSGEDDDMGSSNLAMSDRRVLRRCVSGTG